MLRAMLSVVGAVFALSMLGDPKSTSATYVAAADIQATLKKAPPTLVSDQPIRMVDAGGYNVGIAVVHRPAASRLGSPVEHDKVTEIYHVLEGVGTLVTGGTLVNPERRPADAPEVSRVNGPSVTGTSVQGGETRRIAAGDVIIIPAGVPHWFSEIQESLTYVVMRVDPEKVVPLK
jgi:mannose-6-phosphate isomerase-like protein (cupin superfamily)